MRFYIADDTRAFAEYCADVAEKVGWKVTICCDGSELVDQLRLEETPAIVFVDIQMPVIDGIEVIEELKTLTRKRRVRFVTGGPPGSALGARMIADARGMDTGRFLTKPVSLAKLRGVLAEEAEHLKN
ncbi:response regulator [Antarctobacter jejuensis]|uniref:response regulator n=1 Tax=Antarctobacter jejuensis TaxID=1439938 RepID=UPI003FD005B6